MLIRRNINEALERKTIKSRVEPLYAAVVGSHPELKTATYAEAGNLKIKLASSLVNDWFNKWNDDTNAFSKFRRIFEISDTEVKNAIFRLHEAKGDVDTHVFDREDALEQSGAMIGLSDGETRMAFYPHEIGNSIVEEWMAHALSVFRDCDAEFDILLYLLDENSIEKACKTKLQLAIMRAVPVAVDLIMIGVCIRQKINSLWALYMLLVVYGLHFAVCAVDYVKTKNIRDKKQKPPLILRLIVHGYLRKFEKEVKRAERSHNKNDGA